MHTSVRKGAEQMPFVEVKVFEQELTPDQTQALIRQITDVVAGITGECLRSATWVVVDEVKSGSWGSEARRSRSKTSGRSPRASAAEASRTPHDGQSGGVIGAWPPE
jgi:4-oxalocrotonate tautomerase